MNKFDYTITIQWSDEDNCFVVFFPEFSQNVMQPVTHGETYEEALKNGQEVLELIIEEYQEDGKILPQPKTFVFA
ncbi:type II toxin-antitoxin system HicB family antitoxin [Cyanobacterium aponinum UTEX 3222]|uniref:Type II toxin-antitoxin system HicB family antitoxin n=1 Tax=Cyanobacterium aponinum AL20115 TaxID=3090662 RepID=A0AAF0ZD53_9CHRO|nr:type II toxin-antitoxin system HicB family antitoxin [Cyanobacterium aponinum]PHV61820.1 HicB family protein [Cyanobacterium aponinum IPPAS B-1201]WPF89718.1 type II toxin-antitoxin system HicB family antitoxin [Cyanobacterium aponinum AL20115]WRL38005.1 type II toxin-antitoxin system HicB family antitoxin [Cyanobacterium aponinum UTEX 3221]WRL41514.1 type II toxin-antitoxin system HicB family antitoxin [Cyanobacterium aponinum UTEX 3222]